MSQHLYRPLSDFELGWLIGILEGEGYFGYEKFSYRVQVKMTDLDTIERVAGLFARITGRIPPIHESINKNQRADDSMPYVVSLHGQEVKLVMETVVRNMCYRRRARIWQCLNKFKAMPKRESTNIIALIMKNRNNG